VVATGCSQDRKTPVMINLLVSVTHREGVDAREMAFPARKIRIIIDLSA